MQKFHQKAFSLVELSIVILVIGILIAGITQSSKLIEKMRINSARALTRSSAVNGIKNLALWLETTSETSFVNGDRINDATAIGTWYDINPQENIKSNATSSSSNRPLYYSNSMNGLPALRFDGSDDVITSGAPYVKSGFPDINNNFSIFVVALPTATITMYNESNSAVRGVSGQKYLLGAIHGQGQYGTTEFAGIGISFGTNGVVFYEHTGSYMPDIMSYAVNSRKTTLIEMRMINKTTTLYLNSRFARTGLNSLKTWVFPPYQFGGGQWGNFAGFIGEIIIFSRNLKDEERNAVNSYLKQKWKIS